VSVLVYFEGHAVGLMSGINAAPKVVVVGTIELTRLAKFSCCRRLTDCSARQLLYDAYAPLHIQTI
jgi:hypothetical protein